MSATLVPADGREYNNAASIIEAYNKGIDFYCTDVKNGVVHRRCSCRDFVGKRVKLRYRKDSMSTFATYYPNPE